MSTHLQFKNRPSPVIDKSSAGLTTLYQKLIRNLCLPRRRKKPRSQPKKISTLGDGVYVAPSKLGPAAGNGLFAAQTFKEGEFITGMDGMVFGDRVKPHGKKKEEY